MNIKKIFFVSFLFISCSLLADTGKDYYDRFCTACHSPSMSSLFGSPAAHDLDAWNLRKKNAFNNALEQDSSLKNLTPSQQAEFSINELVKSAINGTDKGMPPRGTCFECSDDDLKAVIKFMSSSE